MKKYLNKIKDYIFQILRSLKLLSKKDEIDLSSTQELIEGYIGIPITSFESYFEDIEDLNDKISSKIIVGTEIIGTSLYLSLSHINGKYGGYIKLSPEINGQFAERIIDDEPSWHSRYRVNFYGGDSFEYIDSDMKGGISYHDGFIRK
jgi:hypothetical protein